MAVEEGRPLARAAASLGLASGAEELAGAAVPRVDAASASAAAREGAAAPETPAALEAAASGEGAAAGGRRAAARAVLAAVIGVTLILLAFAWPTYTSSVKDLPIVVAGPQAALTQLQGQLGAQGPMPFAITHVGDRGEAVAAIKRREAYGALILPSAPGAAPEVLTASAASPVVAQQLSQVTAMMTASLQRQAAAAQGSVPTQPAAVRPVTVTDVVPLAATDPRGAGLTVSGLPLVMGGMLGGVVIAFLVPGRKARLGAVGAYAVVAGLVIALILHPWFGFLSGSFAAEWAAIALSLAATGALIVGLDVLLGRPGIALAAALTLLLGNPLSALAAPKEFLPAPWGEVGQYLVPGASGSLLRSLSYFPDASTLGPWLVLVGWLGVGVACLLGGGRRPAMGHRV